MSTVVEQLTTALAGRYTIEREIGRGGMATVYLARDLRHDRNVALKVLLPELAAIMGPERFLAEIRVTAHLQHPNLLPLFDSGEASGLLYYVMPFVEGESLRARLDRETLLPVPEAVRIASAVASALDFAHRRDVIHRDLKPENILLQDGQPMVADFGIALAVTKAGGARITQTGISLGTPAYMSPEQATGDRTIDSRTDIYSLAAVLFEMLAGDPPHRASNAQAIIAKVLTERPQRIRLLRETVPDYVEAALERALSKFPADRFATAREFDEAITGARRFAPATVPGAPDDLAPKSRVPSTIARRIRSLVPWAVAVAGVAAGTVGWMTRRAPETQRSRFAVALVDNAPLAVGPGPIVALSPDGSRLAYVAEPATGSRRIFVRGMNELDARALPGTELSIRPSFSPNGDWITFTVANRLRKIPAAGGNVVTIADDVGTYAWGDGDVVVFARPSGRAGGGALWRVSATGGTPDRLTTPDTARGEAHLWPHVLPGGKAALFVAMDSLDVATATLSVVRLDGARERDVVRLDVLGLNPRYVPTGHLVFGRVDGTVAAVPFDVDRLTVAGAPVTLTEAIQVKTGGAMELAVAATGTAVFVEASQERRLVFVDRAGRERPAVDGAGRYSRPRLSPDGRRLAVAKQDGADSDIWIYDIDSRTWTRLTTGGRNVYPEWTSDGRRIVWVRGPRGRSEIRWQPWDGSQPAQTLGVPGGIVEAAIPSPDGASLVLLMFAGNPASGDVYITPMDSVPRVRPLIVTPEVENHPAISPDGRWLAYMSDESGQRFVHVRSLSGASGRTVISSGPASEPRWSLDGRQLFYRSSGRVLVATIDTSSTVRVARRDTLFADVYASELGTNFDVSPDGTEFLFSKPVAATRIVVAFGWLDDLREQIATAARD